ncbi:MAG TPA: hypothetical protein VEA59_01745 [Patescibacteria group bacterium]|nr:hypothetical protein [Patescibacteria group bacterium]
MEKIFKEFEEVKAHYEQLLREREGQHYAVIGNIKAWEGLNPDFFRELRTRRAEKGISVSILLTYDSRAFNPHDDSLRRAILYMPQNMNMDTCMDIYDDSVFIVGNVDEGVAQLIQSKSLARNLKEMFDLIWQRQDLQGEAQTEY